MTWFLPKLRILSCFNCNKELWFSCKIKYTRYDWNIKLTRHLLVFSHEKYIIIYNNKFITCKLFIVCIRSDKTVFIAKIFRTYFSLQSVVIILLKIFRY